MKNGLGHLFAWGVIKKYGHWVVFMRCERGGQCVVEFQRNVQEEMCPSAHFVVFYWTGIQISVRSSSSGTLPSSFKYFSIHGASRSAGLASATHFPKMYS